MYKKNNKYQICCNSNSESCFLWTETTFLRHLLIKNVNTALSSIWLNYFPTMILFINAALLFEFFICLKNLGIYMTRKTFEIKCLSKLSSMNKQSIKYAPATFDNFCFDFSQLLLSFFNWHKCIVKAGRLYSIIFYILI